MPKRAYGQYCGLVRALEIVGERWGLLIVRDLMVGPRRYSDLKRGLPRIPTNILSARLRELEGAGVIRRRLEERPGGAVLYELTELGLELEPAVLALGRWGARLLGEPAPGETLSEDAMVMAMRATFQPEAARGVRAGWELHVGPVVFHARVDDGRLHAGNGPLPDADQTIEAGPGFRALLAGELTADEALERGEVRVSGDPRLLSRFAEIFRI